MIFKTFFSESKVKKKWKLQKGRLQRLCASDLLWKALIFHDVIGAEFLEIQYSYFSKPSH